MNLTELLDDIEYTSVVRDKDHKQIIIPYETIHNIELNILDQNYLFVLSENKKHQYVNGNLTFQITFYVENFKDHIELLVLYKGNICCRTFQQIYASAQYSGETVSDFEIMFQDYLVDMINTKKYVLDAYVDYCKSKIDKGQHSIISFSIIDNENEGILNVGEGGRTYIENGEIRKTSRQNSSSHFKIINNKVFTTISHIHGLFGIRLNTNVKSNITSEEEFKRIFNTTEVFFDAKIKANVFLSFDNSEIIISLDLHNDNSIVDFYFMIDNVNSKAELWLFHNYNELHIERDKSDSITKYRYIKKSDFKDTIIEYSNLLKEIFTEQCILYFLTNSKKIELDIVNETPNAEQIEHIKMLIY